MIARPTLCALIAGALGGLLLSELAGRLGLSGSLGEGGTRPQEMAARNADALDGIRRQLTEFMSVAEDHSEHLRRMETQVAALDNSRSRTPVVGAEGVDLEPISMRLEALEETTGGLASLLGEIATSVEKSGGFDPMPDPGVLAAAGEIDCQAVQTCCWEWANNLTAFRSEWLGRSHAELLEKLGKPSWIAKDGKWYWECNDGSPNGRALLSVKFRGAQCTSIYGGG